MKCILIIYLFLEIIGTYYLWTQLEEGFNQHLVLTLPAVLLYIIACFKNVKIGQAQPGYADFSSIKLTQNQSQIGNTECQSTLDTKDKADIGQIIQKRQCRVCKQVQLVRMKHCYDCNLCVATFDHHCIWIQNCVGEKNRHVFYLCIVINLVAVGDAFWLMMAGMWERGEKDTLQLVFLSFLMIIISGLVLLTALHSYLMIANLTTWQVTRWQKIYYLQGRSKSLGSPFSEGAAKNVLEYWLCGMRKGYKEWKVNSCPRSPQ